MGEAIAITSGKGGVGKSSVCINMGMVLAQKGYRVCLIDVDLGLKNLDVMLGLENRVIYDLKDVMEGRCTLANAMIRDKRQDNLYLLPACKTIHIQYFHGEDLKIVVEELKNQFDYILLDTPAGIESGFIHSIACVSRAIVVTTLDVTALQDADRIIGILMKEGMEHISFIVNRMNVHHMDRGISVSLEEAKLDSLYTPEAYQYMKQLEFKSILQKFGEDAFASSEMEKSFRLVNDFGEAQVIFDRAQRTEEIGAQLVIEKGEVVALALCLDGTSIYAIPAVGFLTGQYLAEELERLMEVVPSVTVLDLKIQLPFLKNHSRRIVDGIRNAEGNRAVMDAGVAAYLLNPLKDTYGYDDLARDYLDMTVPSQVDLLGKTALSDAFETMPEKALNCVCYMAYTAWKSREILLGQLRRHGMMHLFYEIEMPVIYSLYHMEEEGIQVRREELKAYGERLQTQVEKLEQEIYAETGCEFNINSPKQLGEVLFEKMSLPGGKKTKTGYSTAADVLEKLAPEYPVVRKVLDYRQVAKLKSTYADGLGAFIREDGRIHGTFNQTITATGRISSTEPNLQNIPVRMELGREIRKLFVPREGCVLVDADYSQIELRVLAHMSNDKNLIQAYRQAEDIHAITASQVFHVPLEEVTPQLRRNAKAVNFGIVYGISAFGLGEDLGISRKEATEYIERYFETYPDVKRFLDGLVKTGRKYGEVKTMYGRVRPIPELKSGNFMQRSFGERVAMNSPIQGTAADIIKIAMIRVDQRLRREGLRSRIVLQVHDELLVETWKEELEQVQSILATEMKRAAQLQVELEIDMKTGNSWFETK